MYVHFPLCAARCTFCAFSITTQVRGPWRERFVDGLMRDAKMQARGKEKGDLDTLYLGGGTPSLASAKEIEGIFQAAEIFGRVTKDTEVSIEVNPSEEEKIPEQITMQELKTLGITRVSIGVQSLEDKVLAKLGRKHTSKEALKRVEEAASVFGAERVSADLLFGFPVGWSAEGRKRVREDAKRVASCVGHMSCYELTVEPGTPLHKLVVKQKSVALPDEEERGAEYEELVECLEKELNLLRYEVSSYAKSKQTQCRHSLGYWEGREYAGIGPAAHARLYDAALDQWTALSNHPDANSWSFDGETMGKTLKKALSKEERQTEMLISGLRTIEGVPGTSEALKAVRRKDQEAMLLEQGMLVRRQDGGLKCSPPALALADGILARLL